MINDQFTEKLEGSDPQLHGAVCKTEVVLLRLIVIKVLLPQLKTRYFYLICFATYAKEFGPGGFEKSFVSVSFLNIFSLFDVPNFKWIEEHVQFS